jgi:RecB family exonuclease
VEQLVLRSFGPGAPRWIEVLGPGETVHRLHSLDPSAGTTVLHPAERAAVLRRYLARWGVTDPSEVADLGRALDDARLASAGTEEIRVHATAAGRTEWLRVAELLDGWSQTLRQLGTPDRVGFMVESMMYLRSSSAVRSFWATHSALVVVDADRYEPPLLRCLTSLLGPDRPSNTEAVLWGASVPVRVFGPTQPTDLAQTTPTPVPRRLVRVGHPAAECEAIVGELHHAHGLGISWPRMAVVCPGGSEQRRAIARAARRAGVPVAGAPAPRLEGPIVDRVITAIDALTELRALTDPDSVQDPSPGTWARVELLGLLGASADPIVQEALLGVIAHAQLQHCSLAEWADLLRASPPSPLPESPPVIEAVNLLTVEDACDLGSTIDLLIIAGAIEGLLPGTRPTRHLDPAVLDGPAALAQADHRHVDAQRHRFDALLATVNSEHQHAGVVLVAAPEPGVLPSRFTEGLSPQPPRYAPRAEDPDRWPTLLTTTQHARPLVAGPSLVLSATQINLFDNCPWHYTAQYRLGLRTEGGLSARIGSYVHEVLEHFVTGQHTYESDLVGLLQLAEEKWTPDLVDFVPQEDDYRRRTITMLTDWWTRDGQDLVATGRAAHVEYEFSIPVGHHRINGFIDRIDTTPDGLAIIDYKTGGTAKSAAATNDDLQLAVYHLAATRDPALASQGPVAALHLDFLVADKQVGQEITADHAVKTEARVLAVADRILAEEHDPSVMADCAYCHLHRVCELQPQGRPVPVRTSMPAQPNPSQKPNPSKKPRGLQ